MRTHIFETPTDTFNDVFFGKKRFLIIDTKTTQTIKTGDSVLLREITNKKVINRQTKHLVGVVEKDANTIKKGFIVVSLI